MIKTMLWQNFYEQTKCAKDDVQNYALGSSRPRVQIKEVEGIQDFLHQIRSSLSMAGDF